MNTFLISLKKLNPFLLLHNPVIFITEIGAFITTIEWVFLSHSHHGFYAQVTLWLWLTVLFSNYAESVAEKRNKAQADTLRKGRVETFAYVRQPNGEYIQVPGKKLRKGDVVRVRAGEVIPNDGEVIEGMAAVDESAVTGESAPVIRAAGTDHSSVTGGTKVVSDSLIIEVSSDPGQSFSRSDDSIDRDLQKAKIR